MKYFLAFIILVSGRLAAQLPVHQISSKVYDVAALQQDFDTLYHWLHSSHPDLHFSLGKKEADKKWNEAKKKLTKPMTRVEFMKLLVPLTTQYKDGHTALYLEPWSPEIKEYTQSGGTLFPAQLFIRDNRAWVKQNFQQNINLVAGDEILAMNGTPIKNIITTLLPYWPADGLRSNENVLSRFFSISLWYLYGWGNEITLEVQSKNGFKKIQLKGLPDSVLTKARESLSYDWKLHIYDIESLAVIECNSYGSMKKAKAFADSAFTVIKEKGIRNLAFDLRKNEGGNSSIGDMILSYVTKKPFAPFTSKKLFREIPMAKLPDNGWVRSMLGQAAKTWKVDGDYYRLDIEPFRPDSLAKPELFFDGNFFLLTSGVTYSSAHMTAIEVKCFKLGTIIGEPTGERMNLSGEMMDIQLPVTGLTGACAAASYVTPCGNARQVGVEPDILVPFNEKDLVEGKDTVIEFLKKRSIK